MKNTKRKLSWKPKLRGSIYCSSACGADCTIAEYIRAVKKSAALAARMGPGWRASVWENLGWHYSVIRGFASVSPGWSGGDTYHASVNLGRQFMASDSDPRRAFRAALAASDEALESWKKCRAAMEAA